MDQKWNSRHLIASQMLTRAVPFDTNPSAIWALGTPNLLPAQPRHTLPISHTSLLHSVGCRSLLPCLSLECTKEKDTTWFKCNSRSACAIQGQEKQGACGTQQPLYSSPQRRAWHNCYTFQEIQNVPLKSKK